MLCEPFGGGDKPRLFSRVNFGDTIPEGEWRNFLDAVKTAEQHEKELLALDSDNFPFQSGG